MTLSFSISPQHPSHKSEMSSDTSHSSSHSVCVLSCPVMSNSLNPMDCSPPGSSVHGVLWARIPEWAAISSSRWPSPLRDWARVSLSLFFLSSTSFCYQPITLHPHAHMLSHVTPWTAARQAPLSMDFFRQGYWSGLPFPSPGQRMFNFNICYSFMAIKCSISFTGFWRCMGILLIFVYYLAI